MRRPTTAWTSTPVSRFTTERSRGFTLIELIVVVSIIALLVGIMVPAIQHAMDIAKNTAVKTQFHAIEVGAEMFKHERRAGKGEYPDDLFGTPPLAGFMSLTIQLVGRDLRGYNVDDDYSSSDTPRLGPFIKHDTVKFVTSPPGSTGPPGWPDVILHPWYAMLCKWGEPILYFRATPRSTANTDIDLIYTKESIDNTRMGFHFFIEDVGEIKDHTDDALIADSPDYDKFYELITNKSLETGFSSPMPYRGNSFILWSAGKDKEYGTADDVTNFGD